jgi:transcription elongation factor Elf1
MKQGVEIMAASVILAKCEGDRAYGIRVEKQERDWVRTWAFPIDEGKAKREGFDETKIKGSLKSMPEYPGCPHCKATELVQCGCGKMFCYKEDRSLAKPEKKVERKSDVVFLQCPWCGVVCTELETVESFSVKTNNF